MKRKRIIVIATAIMLSMSSFSYAGDIDIQINNINQQEVNKKKTLPPIPVEQKVKANEQIQVEETKEQQDFTDDFFGDYDYVEDSYEEPYEPIDDFFQPSQPQQPYIPPKEPSKPIQPSQPNQPKQPNKPIEVVDIVDGSGFVEQSPQDLGWTDWDDFAGFTEFESPSQSSYVGSGLTGFGGTTVTESGDYSGGFGFIDIEKEEHIPGAKFIKPNRTFQYTFNADDEYPIYIDTGVVFREGVIPHIEDIKEIARQITIKTNAKMITDKSRFIILLDDKFEVINGKADDVNVLLKSFENLGINLKIQSSRVGQKFNLADYLEKEGNLFLEINGEKIDLLSEPVLSDSRVLLPIRSIGEGLGAIVNWDKGTRIATITKDDKVIKIESNKDIVTVNGKEYLLGKSTTMNSEDERILSMVNLIVVELGGEMRWSTTDNMLKVRDVVIEED